MYRNFALAILALAAIFAVLSDNVTGVVKGTAPQPDTESAAARDQEQAPEQLADSGAGGGDGEEVDPWAEDDFGSPMVDGSEPDQGQDEQQLASMAAPGSEQSDEEIEIPEPRERPAGAKATERAKQEVERGLQEARAANMARPIEPGGAIRIDTPGDS